MIKVSSSVIKSIKWFFIFVVIDIFYTNLISWIIDTFVNNSDIVLKGNEDSIKDNFELVVFYGPFAETLCFQLAIIWIFYNILENYKISILISSMIFSIFHFFNIYFVIAAFGSGLMLSSYFCIVHKEFKNWHMPFIFTFLFHLQHNLFSFYVNH